VCRLVLVGKQRERERERKKKEVPMRVQTNERKMKHYHNKYTRHVFVVVVVSAHNIRTGNELLITNVVVVETAQGGGTETRDFGGGGC